MSSPARTMQIFDLDRIRAQFPSLDETDNGRPRLYFDNPAGTQVPTSVAERMTDCLLHKSANIGGFFPTSEMAGEVADGTRAAVADFLNASSPDEIIFGQNMTSLTFHVSRSMGRHFKAGDEIILSQMDHDANVEPWKLLARDFDLTVRWLPFDTETFEFDLAKLDELLNEKTRLVCVGGASNLLGTINDVETICSKARAAGAWSFIDAVQSAPHISTDVQQFGCDFFVCSAYKFFGPHQGMLWGRRDVLEQLEAYKVRPAPEELPWSFEPGTQSHEGMAGTAATRLIAGLQSISGVRVLGITDPEALNRRVPTVSFIRDGHAPDAIAEALAERNIFAWSGHNYALEVVRALGIDGAVRIGAVHYNSADEIDTVLNALESILS